ncbi:uncharacterized protein BX663DRAFT_472968 [Cokeromyces recurvatus]|uniref:uncharacterized protein n=1 Tax=Cokeromyces recurvatus TaxID=90255 RepID=UPI0022212176|nr:uncharacterized protein BX663DRAFT_472968 [Cokeromyces recurvatus]KAI7902610.1 hypothetical protein BX663DRAFT_472968 [Cokeromyces recurvatus]
MNYETLEQQTAPESTRGLFDIPEFSSKTSFSDKRRTFHGVSNSQPLDNNRNRKPISLMPTPRHQRSRSAINSEIVVTTSRSSSSLPKNRRSAVGLHILKEEMAVDSLQNMINTLKTLPPIISQERRPSDESMFMSREAALAEAEAKLMGTFNRRDENGNGYIKKRASLQQLPVLNEHGESFLSERQQQSYNKRSSMNSKSLSLSLGSSENRKSLSHRSSRNFDEWRNSTSSLSMNNNNSGSGSNRSSFSLVPFTPTRVNFSRDDANPHQRRPLFIAHLPFSALTPLFRARQLVRGILRVNKRNRSDAYVSCDELDGGDIYICGSRDRNRALEGDVVAVRLVNVEKVVREKQEKEEAKLARNNGQVKVRLPDEEDENEIIFGGDEEIEIVKPKYAGVVVAILERAQNQVFSGNLTLMRPNNKRAEEQQDVKKEAPRIVWFKATDKRVPLIAIPIEQVPADFVENNEAYKDRLFAGSIKRWPITSLHPFGILEKELGVITDLDVQIKAILADNNVSDTPFTEAVMDCIPSPYQFTNEEYRRDLTLDDHHRMITIDPAGSTLFEDGLSITRLGDDTFEVGVHITDITCYIKPHSPLDKEARARAVHVCLDQKEVPMLPTELANIANFTLNESKPAISVIWKISSDGMLLDTWFGKTIVKSCAQLTYEDVQDIIDGKEDNKVNKDIKENILMLYELASTLHQTRYTKDAMSLFKTTLKFDDPNKPTKFNVSNSRPDIIKIVKEFLFMANKCVAQKISSQYPEQALLRRQAPPNSRKIHELKDYASRYLGIQLNITNANTIQESIQAIQDDELRQLISTLVLKTMQPPKYFCTGAFDILKYSHFATGLPLFTHFTAPLRRYADIIVHRQLDSTLTGEKHFYLDRDTVQKLAQHCNVKKEASITAKEQSKLLSLALYLVHKQPQQSMTTVFGEARVIAVMEDYFDVSLPEFGIQRRIHLANLPLWRHEYDPQERALTMFWKQGVIPSTGLQHQWSLSDDEYEEEDDSHHHPISSISSSHIRKQSNEMENNPQFEAIALAAARAGIIPATSNSTKKSASKRASIISSRLSASTGYSSERSSQTIKALDKIRVMLTIEMTRTPPLIRVFAANPYA